MTHTTLFTLGTPFGQWPAVAKSFLDERLLDPAIAEWHQEVVGAPLPEVNGTNVLDALLGVKIDPVMLEQLQALRPAHSPSWGGSDVRLSWTGHAVAQLLPDAKFLIWVEHPARLLAHLLPAADGVDPAAALAIIQSSVQCMVNLVHRHRSRCLVVYSDEAVTHPDALVGRLKDWLGVDRGEVALPAPRAHDPLHLLLSDQLVASCPRLLRDYERLYASCIPLVESDEPPAPRTASLAVEAIEAHRHLVRAAEEGATLASRLRLAEREQSRSREELAKVQRESELLLVQLHQVQEELEQTLLKQQQDQATTEAERESAAVTLQQVSAELEALKGDLADREATSKAEEQLRLDLKRQTQECELMLVQLHQVQEELEHYYLAYRDLEAVQNGRLTPPIANKMASVEIGIERDTPPHRELSLALHDLQVDDRKLDHLHVRLVEHHGRAGLVLLHPREAPAPLAVWEPSGSEGELSFVLLMPTDDHGRQRLQRMGASDWRIAESAIRSIERALDEGSVSAPSSRWANVARRLTQQLADLPARFRFDRVDAVPDPQAAGAFIATFGNVSFGSRHVAQVQLRWRPRAEQADPASVELLRPAGGEVPLPASWPVDATGAWLTAWPLPLAGASRAALAVAWRSMSRTEREFLFGLLDALPAAATAAAHHRNSATMGHGDELVAAATLPLRAAYRLFHGARLRRVVQAARGRTPT